MLMIISGEGKHRVTLEKQKIGEDVLLVLQGGEQPHVGAAVVCEPGKKSKSVRLGSHKDYIVLEPLAQMASKKYNKTVVAVGGIHIENATKYDIDKIIQNCKEIESCI
jgi:gallate decarboxylase subunit D